MRAGGNLAKPGKGRGMAGKAVFQREAFVDFFDEAIPLLRLHYAEIAHFKDIPLDVDVERYLQIERAGMLRIYTARLDGNLVGYAVFFISTNGHYKASLQAVQDVIYLDPARRNSRIGLGLLDFCDAELRREGVQVVMHHVKLAHPALGRILSRKGYAPIDVIYAKRLDVREGQKGTTEHPSTELIEV